MMIRGVGRCCARVIAVNDSRKWMRTRKRKEKTGFFFLSGIRSFVAISQRLEIKKEGRNGFRCLFVNTVPVLESKAQCSQVTSHCHSCISVKN